MPTTTENNAAAPQNNSHTFEQDVQILLQHDAFKRFISYIAEAREDEVSVLHKAPAEQIQQISGRIISYDHILQIVNWPSLSPMPPQKSTPTTKKRTVFKRLWYALRNAD